MIGRGAARRAGAGVYGRHRGGPLPRRVLRHLRTLTGMTGGRYLPPMATTKATAADIAHWTWRVAELERELDAATRLSEVKAIAGELRRTKEKLREAKGYGGPTSQT